MILAAGLTPAWQQILTFDQVEIGEVNRAKQVQHCASGKVLNVGRACHALGASTVTLSPAGGVIGDAMAAEFQRDGLTARWIRTSGPTRTCTTLVDSSSGVVTELVENSARLSEGELEAFLQAYRPLAVDAEVTVLSGSLPPHTPVNFYSQLTSAASGRVILDARGPELLAALPLRPLLVKPNRAELEQTLGRSFDTEQDLLAGMDELIQRGAQWVLVTHGSEPVWLRSASVCLSYAPRPLDRLVNPIGCGDCLAAGVAAALARGLTVPDAVPLGIAAARDNARSLLPARLNRGRVDRDAADHSMRAIPHPKSAADES
ncbi:MAG: bifunctional hydroxymethylpyrimidine kinase/phosphomethylpyrimidine kinase [Planctomycetaceae bacterium]|nr:bifunctional hydroxymethylpyrimidine kinase/phosphomethylpyrimidine kinase [Planctomycetaceae bacterium]